MVKFKNMKNVKKKLILFDIDGTLFDNKNKKVHSSTVEALEELHKTSIIGIATGRAGFMLHSVESILHLIDYYVLINGQYIKAHNEVIYENPIDYDILKKLCNEMDKLDIPYGFEGSDDEALTRVDERVIKAFEALSLNLPPIDKDYYHKNKVYQAWVFSNNDNLEFLERNNPYFQFIRWMDVAFDILPKTSSKGLGMKYLANYLNIDLNDVIAFGDGDNDYEMIKDAGIGIAMGNATDKVKEVADYITDDVSANGIYNALKYYKLIK